MSAIPLPSALQAHPSLDQWLRLERDPSGEGTLTVFTGKVEIGQGITTVIAQIAAEELDISVERVRVVLADTDRTPDEGYTAGSNSTQGSGGAVRQAAAEARALLLEMAARQLDAPAARLIVEDGMVTDPETDTHTSYWELLADRPFAQPATGSVHPKPPQAYRVVGTSVPRLDLPRKVAGAPAYVDDMEMPGMLHGRVVRPPSPTSRLIAADTDAAKRMPGVVAVVQNGSFLAIAAEREEQAVAAAASLSAAAQWTPAEPFPYTDEQSVYDHLLESPAQEVWIVDGSASPQPAPPRTTPPPNAAVTLTSSYMRPFQMHGALGPSSALARMQDGRLTAWTHSQGVFPLRGALAQALDMPIEAIRLIHIEGPGCYGHNGADDVVLDAALVARALPGRPILLKWSREDEHRWEPVSPAMVVQIQASLDENGRIMAWDHDVWSYSHSGRPGRTRPGERVSTLLAANHLADPIPPPERRPGSGSHNGGYRNADPIYDLPQRRVVEHFVADCPVRTSSMRSLGAYANVFAIESTMDDLARAAEIDPIEFRLRHLTDERARAVLEAAAERAQWQPRIFIPGSGMGKGRGVAFARYKNSACYAALIVDLHVDPADGVIHLDRVVIAADSGRVINPDGLANQLEGGVIQAASWTLMEAVRFDIGGDGEQARPYDWETYPVLRLAETPTVETVLLDRPDLPPLGVGEATHGPTPAAIANALVEAIGVRLHRLPFTPGRVLAALNP